MFYISGWQALNIPSENGRIADWHPYFKHLKLFELKDDSILGMRGIKKRFIPFLEKEFFVANYPRAIADLLENNQTAQLKGSVRDFLMDEEKKELFSYLKLLPPKKEILNFIKKELPIHYLRDLRENKKNA